MTRTRKLLQLIGCAGPGLCLAYLALVPQRVGARTKMMQRDH
jgi:hypothetical protein